MYHAIVCPLSSVDSIPGKDRIVRAEAAGHVLVVSAERQDGDLGVLFPFEGVLDLGFARAAGLLAVDPDTGAKLGGYLDDPPRIRALKFGGVRSEGIWLSIEDFCSAASAAIGAPVRSSEIEPGQRIDVLVRDGKTLRLCKKWTPRFARPAGAPRAKTHREDPLPDVFPQHYETAQLRSGAGEIPRGARIECSEKIHGTSFRLGRVRIPRPLNFAQRAANRIAGLFGRRPFDPAPLQVVAGSRRVAFVGRAAVDGYYRDAFRQQIADFLGPKLRPGEILYGEVAGFDAQGRPIMAQQDGGKLPEVARAYGRTVTYGYGCEQHGEITGGRPPRRPEAPLGSRALAFPAPAPRYRVYLYRVTLDGRELPPDEVRRRAIELEIEPVPLLDAWAHESARDTLDRARALAEGPTGILPSTVDPRHPREGVVARATAPGYDRAFKFKGWAFGVLEGYRAAPDREEADEAPADEAEAA